ncbi:MAG: hypothetical protein AMJ53_03870 [Gammaproteobacteria bacterium SG8_11]|nr:MAG: hypothetical protein AMJ53_03870 [Gammaproteobacteria bacterium SG8_11]
MKPQVLLVTLFVTLALPAYGQTLTFSSPQTQTTLIELFTSEGCSSCPPADRWMSELKNDTRLWKEFIPLTFHVDYWNYLGWPDPFSEPAHSHRQREYARHGYARSVYTPGFFINGREWSAWFRKPVLSKPSAQNTGMLSVNIDQQALTANYQARDFPVEPLQLHVAVLGFDIHTNVTKGENRGKILSHDFVVLAWHSLADQNADRQWQMDRKTLDLSRTHARAIAVWVTVAKDPTPLQATGGWIDSISQY